MRLRRDIYGKYIPELIFERTATGELQLRVLIYDKSRDEFVLARFEDGKLVTEGVVDRVSTAQIAREALEPENVALLARAIGRLDAWERVEVGPTLEEVKSRLMEIKTEAEKKEPSMEGLAPPVPITPEDRDGLMPHLGPVQLPVGRVVHGAMTLALDRGGRTREEAVEGMRGRLTDAHLLDIGGRYSDLHGSYGNMLRDKRIPKTDGMDRVVAIEALILRGNQEAGEVVSQEAIEKLTQLAEFEEGRLRLKIFTFGTKDLALANIASKALEGIVEVEVIVFSELDDAGSFISGQMESLEGERPTSGRFVMVVSSNLGSKVDLEKRYSPLETITGNSLLAAQLKRGNESKAALRIIGSNLQDDRGIYGRICSILAIPIDIGPVTYMEGNTGDLAKVNNILRSRLGIEAMNIGPLELERAFSRYKKRLLESSM